MTFRDLFARRLTRPTARRTLWCEPLEARDVPSVTLRDLPETNALNQSLTDVPVNVATYFPVTATDTPAGPVAYTVASDAEDVSASILQGGRTLKIDVSGTDKDGVAFTGTITLRLFEDSAPLATGTLIKLAQDGFFNGKLFHRIIDGFIIQGGSPNGDGIGGSTLPDVRDEFDRNFTFSSSGVVAMANARDDNNNSQFFVTDIDTPLSGRPQYLNFNHTIVGILTSGFDTYQKIITTRLNGSTPTNPVTMTAVSVIDDTANAVVRVVATGAGGSTANVTVTADDGQGATTEAFRVTPVAANVDSTGKAVNNRPFLGNVGAQAVATNGTTTFNLGVTDTENDALQYRVGTATNLFGTPLNVSATVDPSTGNVTLTAGAGFTGNTDILVGVWDGTDRTGGGASDAGNYDTQLVTVTVQAPTEVSVALSSTVTTAGVGQTVPLTATLSAASAPTGTVEFFADGVRLGSATVSNNVATFTATFATAGSKSLQAKFLANGPFAAGDSNALSFEVTPDAQVVAVAADGADAGTPPNVRVTNADGTERFTLTPYETAFTGGVRTAVADVNGDGQDDVICVPGFGGAPLIRVYDGRTGSLIKELMVFEESFRGGLYVDIGDTVGLGYAQILVGAGFSGGPRVTLFDVRQDTVLLNYFAYDPTFRGGVAVDFADLKGDGKFYITTGPGKGGGPDVKVFDPAAATAAVPNQVGSTFTAGDAANRDGIRVGAGGVINGTKRNILVGPFEPDSAPLSASYDPTEVGVFPS